MTHWLADDGCGIKRGEVGEEATGEAACPQTAFCRILFPSAFQLHLKSHKHFFFKKHLRHSEFSTNFQALLFFCLFLYPGTTGGRHCKFVLRSLGIGEVFFFRQPASVGYYQPKLVPEDGCKSTAVAVSGK